MHLIISGAGATVLLALAVFAHAWVGKIQGPQPFVNAMGWFVSALTLVVLCTQLVHCG